MSLGRKATLFVALGVLSLALLVVLSARLIVLRQFAQLEEEQTSQRTRDAAGVVQQMVSEFSLRGKDWYDWDDLRNFLEKPTQEFKGSSLGCDSLVAVGWSLFVVRRADGQEIYAMACDLAARKEMAIPTDLQKLLSPEVLMKGVASHGPPVFGIHQLGGKLYLLSSAAIRSSAGEPGPVAGRMITGKVIDAEWLERLRKFTRLAVSLTPGVSAQAQPGQVKLTIVSPKEVAGELILKDLHNLPTATLRVSQERTLVAHGERILKASLLAITLGGLVFGVVTLLAMRRAVLTPIRSVLKGIRSLEAGNKATVVVASRDELGALADGFNRMTDAIVDREARLADALGEVKLVLDSTGDALIGCNLQARMIGSPSRAAYEWFDSPQSSNVADWLFSEADSTRRTFLLGLDDLAADFMPSELVIDQLPKRMKRGEHAYGLQYRRIDKAGQLDSLLIIISDITSKLEAERAEREARELQEVVGNILRDPADFERFLEECEDLLKEMGQSTSLEVRRRHLHTLKGNSAIFGFATFADDCHTLEDWLAEEPEAFALGALEQLRASWQVAIARVLRFAPPADSPKLVLGITEYKSFLEMLETRANYEHLTAEARRWVLQPGSRLFARLAQQAARIGKQCGKEVQVDIRDNGVRLAAEPMRPLLSALVHAVRNAVDHGIESPDERTTQGKPKVARLLFELSAVGDSATLKVRDDGRGINWEAARRKALEAGLPAADQAQLAETLFADGFSTQDVVSALSGRGVGLPAVRAACKKLGGSCRIGPAPSGVGTELTCTMSVTAATKVVLAELATHHSVRPLSLSPVQPSPGRRASA